MQENTELSEKPDESGYILGVVLIFFLVFSLLGMAFIRMADSEGGAVVRDVNASRAYYFAAGGIHKGLWRLNAIGAAAASFSDSSVTVAFDSLAQTMTATGSAGQAQKSIRVTLEKNGTWQIKTWEDG